jgi:hypothetical protein
VHVEAAELRAIYADLVRAHVAQTGQELVALYKTSPRASR